MDLEAIREQLGERRKKHEADCLERPINPQMQKCP